MIPFDRASAAENASTSAFTRRVALWLAAVVASLAVGPRAPVYWDSLGYVEQAITGRPGGLALGRPAFVLLSHGALRVASAAGISPWHFEALLRNAWLAAAAAAAPLAAEWAIAEGMTASAAWTAGLLVALSPAGAHTRDAVLTDGPAAAVVLAALVAGARGAPLAAGALLGVAFGFREQSALHAATLAVMLARRHGRVACAGPIARAAAAFALVGAATVAAAWLANSDYPRTIPRWLAGMAAERREHRDAVRATLAYAGWLVALSPLALGAAVAWWLRSRTSLRLVLLPGTAGLLLLSRYQDIAWSPRYLLTEFVVATTLPAAAVLRPAAWWIAPSAAVLPIAGMLLRRAQRETRAALDETPAWLRTLPDDAVVVTAQPCTTVRLALRIARSYPSSWPRSTPRWTVRCAGWNWRAADLDGDLARDAVIALDLRDGAWIGATQRARLAEVRAFADRHAGDARILSWRGAPRGPR